MSISSLYGSIKSILPKKPGNDDKFGQDITGANNPVANRTIAEEGEGRAVDKKKSSVLKNVLSKIVKRKS